MPVATLGPMTATAALDRVDQLLDLANVRAKLAGREEGKRDTSAELDLQEGEYRRFLALHIAYPEADIVPCHLVDQIWHQHILDTIAYREDCDAIFGRFIDHYPYFGMRGAEDAAALSDAYAATIRLYRAHFGEPPSGTWIAADADCLAASCHPEP